MQTYTIGGTVSGLAGGASLQLSNNGNDAITVNANGAFSFATAVNSGGTYDVWISKEPLEPPQFCVVNNGKGAAVSNVTSVQVVCNAPTGQTLYTFGPQPDGIYPAGTPIFDNLGNLYGVTTYGGANGGGTVFMLTPGNGQWTETVLYTFCPVAGCADGSQPGAGLIWDAAGNLYGTTNGGGAFGKGVAFKLSRSGGGTWTETVLHSFGNGTDGNGQPDGISSLVFDSSGNLYGSTTVGGNGGICSGAGCGVVFELSPNHDGTWTESVIYNFCSAAGNNCPDGAIPEGKLAIDTAGNLYGTTYSGGGNGGTMLGGTVFQLTHQGDQWIEKVLYVFNPGSGGLSPKAGVILDAAGNLYGTTYGGSAVGNCGCGTVFELIPVSGGQWQQRWLYSFSETDGAWPSAPLIFDRAGNVYSTTPIGGATNAGVVFALTPGLANTQAPFTGVPLYSFSDIHHRGDVSGLAMDAQGNLYGFAAVLGADGNGIVFKVTP